MDRRACLTKASVLRFRHVSDLDIDVMIQVLLIKHQSCRDRIGFYGDLRCAFSRDDHDLASVTVAGQWIRLG